MTYKTTPLCDEDIVNIYLRGVADFGIDQAEAYDDGGILIIRVLHGRQDWERHLKPLAAPTPG